jgi:hypothetical protein
MFRKKAKSQSADANGLQASAQPLEEGRLPAGVLAAGFHVPLRASWLRFEGFLAYPAGQQECVF